MIIEDACQTAWTRLAVRTDIAIDGDLDRVRGWLYTVAVHEAWQLSAGRERCGLLEELPDAPCPTVDTAARVLEREVDREQLRALAELKPAEREALILQAAGHSYAEIAQITGATYTAVNRRLTEGRAHLRSASQA